MTPVRDEAARYLKLIGNGATQFTFQTFDDDQKRKDQGQTDKSLLKVLHGSLDQHFNTLAKLNAKGAGIYVTVNETDLKGRKADNIVKVRCLFLDLDGAPLPTDGPEPTLVVETSPGRWHVYWLVDDVALEDFRGKQKGLIQQYGGDNVHDLPRVMRLPGFFHRKGEPSLVRIVKANGSAPHKASEFPTAKEERHVAGDTQEAADLEELAAAVAAIKNDDLDWETWNKRGMAMYGATGDSEAGFAMFDGFSQKSTKYNAKITDDRWKNYRKYPPTDIGAGTLFWLASQDDPDWLRRYDAAFWAEMERVAPHLFLRRGKQQEAQQQGGEKKEEVPEEQEQGPRILVLRLATKLWGAGERINQGQWVFGAEGEISLDAFTKKWFNMNTGANGGINDLITMTAALYPTTTAADSSSVVLVRATDVIIRQKNWLWEGHLARGGLELMTGIPGLGKSQVQCSYVACATTGCPWPDGAKGLPAPVNVIMVTAEDALDQDVVPRLIAAKADLNRVHILKCIKTDEKQRQFLLSEDLARIEQAMAKLGNVGLITLDPITAYMGSKIDSRRATEVRSQLGPLKDFAEGSQVAFSAITHPAKNAGKRAIDHFIESQAFIAAARIGHACFAEVIEEAGEKKVTGRVLFTTVKHTSTGAMSTLAFRIIGGVVVGQDEQTRTTITSSHVVWDEKPVDITADGALAAGDSKGEAKGEQAEVKKFLLNLLAAGKEVPQQEIMEAGAQIGFSEKQIRSAARKLGVVMTKSGFQGASLWILPV